MEGNMEILELLMSSVLKKSRYMEQKMIYVISAVREFSITISE